MSATVIARMDGPVAGVVFNRPEVLNAANAEWVEDLHAALDLIEQAGAAVRVAVFSGAGRAFCSGLDLDALVAGEINIGWFCRWEEALERIEKLEPVTLAKIHGVALGGGLQAALACDLRLAADDAQFGMPAVREALIPGLAVSRLPRYIGLGRARRMILSGEPVGAREALAIGLVDWVEPEAELDRRARLIIEDLLKGSRTAQHLVKKLTFTALHAGPREFRETYLEYVAQALASEEHVAAVERRRAERV